MFTHFELKLGKKRMKIREIKNVIGRELECETRYATHVRNPALLKHALCLENFVKFMHVCMLQNMQVRVK